MNYISNPFQVLGVSDPPMRELTPQEIHDNGEGRPAALENPAPVASLLPSVATAAPVVPSAQANAMHAGGGPMLAIIPAPLAPNEHLTFLHRLGTFFLDDVLPVVLQVGVPILERKI